MPPNRMSLCTQGASADSRIKRIQTKKGGVRYQTTVPLPEGRVTRAFATSKDATAMLALADANPEEARVSQGMQLCRAARMHDVELS